MRGSGPWPYDGMADLELGITTSHTYTVGMLLVLLMLVLLLLLMLHEDHCQMTGMVRLTSTQELPTSSAVCTIHTCCGWGAVGMHAANDADECHCQVTQVIPPLPPAPSPRLAAQASGEVWRAVSRASP